jgi:imidazole glycerol-phosphate synthase subunit HisF
MLSKRIIPCLDVKDGRVVKGVRFVDLQDAGDPAALAGLYDREGADELVFLDISASVEGRKTMVETVRRVAAQVFIPFTVGGGISSVDDMTRLLRAGADKISLNTAAVENPQLIDDGARRFGSQCVVVAVDAVREDGGWQVLTHGGRQRTQRDVLSWVREAMNRGAGEILLTCLDRDGTRDGYDTEITACVAESVSIPVIASGGAGNLAHFRDVLTMGKADAALAASVFHYGTFRIRAVKEYLQQEGVAVRL